MVGQGWFIFNMRIVRNGGITLMVSHLVMYRGWMDSCVCFVLSYYRILSFVIHRIFLQHRM